MAYNTVTGNSNRFLAYFDTTGNKKWIRLTQPDSSYTAITGHANSRPYALPKGSLYYLRRQKSVNSRPLAVTNVFQDSASLVDFYTQLFTRFTDTVGQTTIVALPSGPANDSCSKAMSLFVNPSSICNISSTGNTSFATPSPFPALACSVGADDDIWSSFVSIDTVHIVQISNFTRALAYALYKNDCINAQYLFCTQQMNDTIRNLVPGSNYLIRIWTEQLNVTDSFKICITTPDKTIAPGPTNPVYDWAVYPTPANTQITLRSPYSSNLPLYIYQSDGKLVMRLVSTGNFTTFNLNHLSSGYYVLKVIIDNTTTKEFRFQIIR